MLALAVLAPLAQDMVIAPGTHLPIRFLEPVTSGRDTVGTAVLVQTMGALVRDSCIVVPPYLRMKGHSVVSRGGQDVGVIFKPWEPQATHRIEAQTDRERDRVVGDLAAGGCADLSDYITLPDAVTEGRNVAGQKVVSDGRTAVVRLRACSPVGSR